MSYVLTTIHFELCALNFFFIRKISIYTLKSNYLMLRNRVNLSLSVYTCLLINVILIHRMSWNFEFNFPPFI